MSWSREDRATISACVFRSISSHLTGDTRLAGRMLHFTLFRVMSLADLCSGGGMGVTPVAPIKHASRMRSDLVAQTRYVIHLG